MFHLRITKYRDEKSASKRMGMSCLWRKAGQRYQCCEEYIGRGIKKNSIRELPSRAGTARINACGDSRLRGQ